MEFDDVIASLRGEFGAEGAAEGGAVVFAVAPEGGGPVEVSVSEMDDGASVLLCADVGEMPSGGGELMLRMLEANHLFASTGGATLSVDGGRVKLERYVGLAEFDRRDAAAVVEPFAAVAQEWRGVVAAEARSGREPRNLSGARV
jgi:hypothetical protein